MKKLALVLLLLAGVIVGAGFYRTLTTPGDLRFLTQEFSGCPSRPSCVSSVAQDETHAIAPLRYEGTVEPARVALLAVIAAMPGTRIEHQDSTYIHAVFLTPLMRFHDDVELLILPEGVINVRSSSRFGYRDHGVNRKRVEEIRSRFDAAKGSAAAATVAN